MTLFWSLSALLAVLAALFVVIPLLRSRGRASASHRATNLAIYRDQLGELDVDLRAGTLSSDQYDKARRELEARLLEDVGTAAEEAGPAPRRGSVAAIVAGVAVPLCALGVYLAVGAPGAIVPPPAAQQADGAHGVTAEQVEAMVESLAARLRAEPGNAAGWAMLGRSYAALGRFQQAVSAYAKAVELMPNDAQLFADYADTLAMAQGQSLEGEPAKLVARALELDPKNLKALALGGTVAFNRGNYAEAARLWERMLAGVEPESDNARSIRANIDEARARAGEKPAKPSGPATAARGASLSGEVRLAPELAAKVSPGDTVFIFARAHEGPPMPLAVLRKKADELPLKFSLDDSMAMAPGLALSQFARVTVTARISKSANANPQPGDLQGASAAVVNDASGVAVVIDTVVR